MQQRDTMHATLPTGGSNSWEWGANASTVVAVTGAVLYAQGLWGLWCVCFAQLLKHIVPAVP